MTINAHEWIFGLALLVIVAFLLRSLRLAHRSRGNSFSFDVMLADPASGKTSFIRVAGAGAFVATTFGLLYITFAGKLDAGVLGVYGTMWVTPILVKINADGNVATAAATSAPTVTTNVDRQTIIPAGDSQKSGAM